MDRKSQRRRQGPGVHYSVHQASTTSRDQAYATERAKVIEALVAPVFDFPFTTTYPSELEISDSEDTSGIAAETVNQITVQNLKNLNLGNQIQYPHSPSRSCGINTPNEENDKSQSQISLAMSAQQAPIEKLVNDTGRSGF